MNDEIIKKGIEELRKIEMTSEEKSAMRERILGIAPQSAIQSPYLMRSIFTNIRRRPLVYTSIVLIYFIILGAGGVVFASAPSLPGDILYPIKVDIVEPLHSFLITSAKAKAIYESQLAQDRLIEAEKLASQNKLNAKNENTLSSLLVQHTDSFQKNVDALRNTGPASDVNIADGITTDFNAAMNAHAQMLDLLITKDNAQGASAPNNDNNNISETARGSAKKVWNTLEEDSARAAVPYDKRKAKVQSIVDSTALNLSEASQNDSQSSGPAAAGTIEQKIIDNTNETLDHARQQLKEADQENQKGDAQNASLKLLDSESSAKEAKIFLQTGLDLSHDKNGDNQHGNEDSHHNQDHGE